MKVKGTVLINFEIDLEENDISEDSMTMYESDLLIAKEIDRLLPKGFDVESDIYVSSID